jgi:hypothetical protein
MRQLIITDVSKPITFNDYLPQNTRIGLAAVTLAARWHNLISEAKITVRKAGPAKDLNPIILILPPGFYTLKGLGSFINAQGKNNISLDISVPGGGAFFKISIGYEASITTALVNLLGMTTPRHVQFTAGSYKITPKFYSVDRLYLRCDQLDPESTLLNGKKSNVLALLPLTTGYKMGDTFTFRYEQPIYLPLKGSTDVLSFTLTDDLRAPITSGSLAITLLIND